MQPKHVKEGYRLLNKSIIRVEQPDVHLEDEDDVGDEAMDVDENTAPNGQQNGNFSYSLYLLDCSVVLMKSCDQCKYN